MATFTKTLSVAQDATAAVHLKAGDAVSYSLTVAAGEQFTGQVVLEYGTQRDTPYWILVRSWGGDWNGETTIASGEFTNDTTHPSVYIRLRCKSSENDSSFATITEIDTVEQSTRLESGKIINSSGQILAEFRPVEVVEHAAMLDLLVGHLLEHLGRARILGAQPVGETVVDARILLLVGDREGENFLFAQVGKTFHRGIPMARRAYIAVAPSKMRGMAGNGSIADSTGLCGRVRVTAA